MSIHLTSKLCNTQQLYQLLCVCLASHHLLYLDRGAVAHLGERLNGIQEVGGSSPPSSTNFLFSDQFKATETSHELCNSVLMLTSVLALKLAYIYILFSIELVPFLKTPTLSARSD